MAIHRKRFVSIKLVVVRTQALYRGHVQRTNQRLVHYQAVIIQRNWRCFFQFTKYMIAYGDIVIAQCAVRRYLCIMRAMRLRAANIVLQCAARQKLACRRVREIRSMTRAAQQIQAAYRGSLTRQEFWWKHSQATLIQAQYRGHISRVLFALERYDVAVVQSLVRRWLARRFVLRTRDGIVALQAAARALIARRTMHQLWLQKRTNEARVAAGVTVQNAYRGYLVRRNMAVLHEMATCIQATFRRHYQHLWYCMYLIDVTIVQSQVRRWIVKHRLKQAHSSAIVLQSCARKMQANREVANMRSKKLLRENQNLACIALQKDWRGHKSRKLSEMHASARKIQKTWRCFVAHVEYLVQQISVIRLQAHIRRFQVQRIFEKTKIGFVRLQAATRGFLKREHVRFISMSAIIVQSCFRGHLQRRAFLYARRSATLIQGVARGYFVRDELLLSHFAATEIQRVWRGFIQFCDFFVHLEATVKLQSFFRKIRAIMQLAKLKLTAHVDRCFYNNKARTIQCKCRAYLHRMRITRATKMIQRLAKSYIRDRQASVVDRGVKRLQAVVRAKEIRRRRTKEVAAVVVRLHMAHKKARRDPKLQIGYKTRHALEVLQTSRSLAEIMDAVKSLETSTRLSPLCCVLFTEANAARILLDLIRSCNRSVPHVELVQCILLTLDNVSQYRKLVPSFADYNSAEIFLDKMQMFRDKDGIFCLSTSLLKCIAKCNPIVEEFCAMHEHLKRLKALHQLSLRRSKSSVSGMKRDVSKKLNRMKRREHFDRNVAIKSLGEMVEKFESHEFVSSTMETGRQHHFTF